MVWSLDLDYNPNCIPPLILEDEDVKSVKNTKYS